MNILVTGGSGFIGSNFIRYLLKAGKDAHIVNYDKLTYAGNPMNLEDIEKEYSERYTFIKGDICDKNMLIEKLTDYKINYIINFAAESHVDRSIIDSEVFIKTNITGTKTLLDIALKFEVNQFIQISTDEVYGSLGKEGKFSENSLLMPNSPYSASKASADLVALSYYKTYGLPVIVTRCSNNYGPYQFPEKFIPLLINNALEDKHLPIYGDGRNVRDWIYVEDHVKAIELIMKHGKTGEIYNIGGDAEKENIAVTLEILDILNKSEDLIKYVDDRPGHDRRYAIDHSKLTEELGWAPEIQFDVGLEKTINWYKGNLAWLDNVKTKEYKQYYDLNYEKRLGN